MQQLQFEQWLERYYITATGSVMDLRSRGSRISNCRTVERYEGDLDAHFARDQLQKLLQRLQYSKDDERTGRRPEHRVNIDGNIYNGTATLRAAVNLYLKFKENGDTTGIDVRSRGDAASARRAFRGERKNGLARAQWPKWEQPQDNDILELARTAARFCRYLAPEIVAAIADDNRRRAAEWTLRFRALSIDPDPYLWDGSPCAWPGIRRYSGSAEIAAYRKKAPQVSHPPDALSLAITIFRNRYGRSLSPTGSSPSTGRRRTHLHTSSITSPTTAD